MTANEGEPLKLECHPPYGFPAPRVNWMILDSENNLITINDTRILADPEGNLWFSNVTLNDTTNNFYYICVATCIQNSVNRMAGSVSLNVIPNINSNLENHIEPVQQYVSRKNETGLLRNTIKLFCVYGGTPLPNILWSKDGESIKTTGHIFLEYGGKKLIIENATFDDSGTYTCDISNGIGNSQAYSIRLDIHVAPNFIIEPNFENAMAKDTVEFKCEATGIPQPYINWIHNGRLISNDESNPRMSVNSNNSLVIENIEPEDIGNYGCNASNIHGYIYKDVYLNINGSHPIVIDHMPSEEATVGHSAILKCPIIGSPRPLIIWYRNGVEVDENRYKIESNYDLDISNITKSDEGEYKCKGLNRFGSTETFVNLEVKRPTIILNQPETYNVLKGGSITLPCYVFVDTESELKVTWSFNGYEIYLENDPRFSINEDNSLSISDVTEDDFGFYECSAYTELDDDKITIELIVQDSSSYDELQIIEAPQNQKVSTGTNVTFRCQAYSKNASYIIYNWFKDEKEIFFENNSQYILNSDNSMTIPNVISLHNGNYICDVSDGEQNINQSATLNVQDVSEPPPTIFRHISEPEQMITTTLKTGGHRITTIFVSPEYSKIIAGNSVKFYCNVTVDDPVMVNVTWKHNNKTIDIENDLRFSEDNDYTFIIADVKSTDSGHYTCVATTNYDEVEASLELIVRDTPLEFLYRPKSLMVKLGDSARFNCQVNDNYLVNIDWLVGASEFNSKYFMRYQISDNNTLLINQVTKLDRNYYTCAASVGDVTIKARARLLIVPVTEETTEKPSKVNNEEIPNEDIQIGLDSDENITGKIDI